jgi:hypothetical protein
VLAYVHRPFGLEAAGPDEFGPIKNPEEPRGLRQILSNSKYFFTPLRRQLFLEKILDDRDDALDLRVGQFRKNRQAGTFYAATRRVSIRKPSSCSMA